MARSMIPLPLAMASVALMVAGCGGRSQDAKSSVVGSNRAFSRQQVVSAFRRAGIDLFAFPGSRVYYGSSRKAAGFSVFVFLTPRAVDAKAFARGEGHRRQLERDLVHGSASQDTFRNLVVYTPDRSPKGVRLQITRAERLLERG